MFVTDGGINPKNVNRLGIDKYKSLTWLSKKLYIGEGKELVKVVCSSLMRG